MKCTIPEISWHNRDPVLSVDVQPVSNTDLYRLASGGTDSHVLIWHLRILDSGATSVEPVSDLTRHQRAVNVVRWSPSGQYLASGDDDANIIVWQQKADELSVMIDGETSDKEKWSVYKVLRGHKEDVYDISWSPNSLKLLSGSVDNTAIIWDLAKGNNDNILKDHKGFVQGVSWDPQGQFLATLSSDRTCRIFNETGKQVRCRMSKGCLNVPEGHSLHGQVVRFYHDDTLKSFFRRLSFSPDGNLLVTPAGCLDSGQPNKPLYTTYIYNSNSFTQPAAILPSPGQYTVAVRCCPMLFELRPDGRDPAIILPYRMIIAVATRSSVVLYDTQQLSPFAVISNIHYTRLTDLTWSHDGRILAVSSTDGFCSLVTFEPNELGTEYIKEDSDEENLDQSVCEENANESITEEKPEEKKEEKKRNSFLKQWATKKNVTDDKKDLNSSIKERNTNIIQIDDSPPKKKIAIDGIAKPIAVKRKPQMEPINSPSLKSAAPIAIKKTQDAVHSSSSQKSDQPNTPTSKTATTIPIRKKPKNQDDINSPSTKTSARKKLDQTDSPSSKISVPAKPIAVRRKPRDQMDITKFLKSPNEPPAKKLALEPKEVDSTAEFIKNESKKISKKDIIIVSEDSGAQDAWTLEKTEVESKQSEIITIEDSQDMKLVLEEESEDIKLILEDTNPEEEKHSSSLEDFEKFHKKQNNCKDTIDDKPQENPIESNICEPAKENTDENIDRINTEKPSTNSTKCDLENNSDKGAVVNDIKNKINDLQIQPGSIQRKKVPFITLSSPKSKKKNS